MWHFTAFIHIQVYIFFLSLPPLHCDVPELCGLAFVIAFSVNSRQRRQVAKIRRLFSSSPLYLNEVVRTNTNLLPHVFQTSPKSRNSNGAPQPNPQVEEFVEGKREGAGNIGCWGEVKGGKGEEMGVVDTAATPGRGRAGRQAAHAPLLTCYSVRGLQHLHG